MNRFLTLVACASASLSFSVDPAFTESEQKEIRRAAETWNAITEDQITFDGADWRIEQREPPLNNGRQPAGACYPRVRLILIHPNLQGTNTSAYAVALHEFGHAHGLKHVAGGVMDANEVHTEFTAADMAECRRVGACR